MPDYSKTIADRICERLAGGESLRLICGSGRAKGLPGQTTVYRWLAENEGFQRAYALAREAQADLERDFLVRELSRAVGLGGRDRRAGSASERARVGVTRAVRQAMTRISGQHAELGEHLGRTIRTGTYCSYLPDPRVPADWEL